MPETTTVTDYMSRMVVDGTNRGEWLAARARGITATDVAKITDRSSMMVIATKKLMGSPFTGNKYTQHGIDREPVIASWVTEKFGIEPSSALFHADGEARHLATPDGVSVVDGVVVCSEIKTTKNDWDEIPADYLRQVQWQQYVLGAERTLFAWEPHQDFVPVYDEPRSSGLSGTRPKSNDWSTLLITSSSKSSSAPHNWRTPRKPTS